MAPHVDTLVIFMGGTWLEAVAGALIEVGLSPSTPVAVVSHATCVDQSTVLGSLQDIAPRVRQANINPPMLIVVGEVTRLSEALNWFGITRRSL